MKNRILLVLSLISRLYLQLPVTNICHSIQRGFVEILLF
mgnify:CR=1 FL=1